MADQPTPKALAEKVIAKAPPAARRDLSIKESKSYARIVHAEAGTLAYVKTNAVSFTRGDVKKIAELLPAEGKDPWHRRHDGTAEEVAAMAKLVAAAVTGERRAKKG